MFDKKISTRIILTRTLWAALSIALAAAAIFVASGAMSKIADSLAQKKRAAFQLQERSAAIVDLQSEIAVLRDNDAKLALAFPPDDNISQFLAALDELARQKSIQATVHVSNPAPTSLGGDGLAISEIDYTLTLNGTAVTLLNYLKGFEALPYFSGIRSITINSPSDWNGNSSITMQAILYTKQASQ